MDMLFYMYFVELGIIIFTYFEYSCALSDDQKCPRLCVCKPRNTAKCINRGKDLYYIPKLPVVVKILVFVDNYLPYVNRSTFKNVSSNAITSLNLTNNGIQYMSEDAFIDFKSMYILDLSDNNRIKIASLQQSFKRLHFMYEGSLHLRNIFQNGEIPPHFFKEFAPTSYLQKIYLQKNNLVRVYGESLKHLSHLVKLDLSENDLVSIDLHGLHKLTMLILDSNNFHRVPTLCGKNRISLVGHLRLLSMNSNRIRSLQTFNFICGPRIEFLYFLDNPVTKIEDNVFAPLRKLRTLHIKVSNKALKHLDSYAFNASNLRRLSLAETNFKFKRGTFDPDNVFSHCPWLNTLILSNNRVPSDSETTIRMFGKLKKLIKLILQYVGWRVIPGNLFHRLPNLKVLDLGHNNIFSLSLNNPFENMKGLSLLGLSGNKLNSISSATFLPKELLSNLKTLNLANNPFACHCDLIWFVQWLNKTDIVMQEYPMDYYCVMPLMWKGKPLNSYTEDCTIHSIISLKTILIPSGSALIVILAIAMVVYKIRWHIRYWIYLIRAKSGQYSKLPDTEFMYEGFVVYCDTDRKWVHEKLVPCIEEEHGFKLCIHYRDFQVGKLIVDNIVESMEESRKVILVLSNAFAKSEWCQFEVLLAHKRFMDNGHNDLIVVLLEDVNSKHFTNALKLIMTSTTYAIWSGDEIGQRLFWNQILSAFDNVQNPVYDRLDG